MEITAVEWLIEKMSLEDVCKFSNQFAEAKEMEKQQIIDAVNETMQEMNSYESFRTFKSGEQYYNETFKQK